MRLYALAVAVLLVPSLCHGESERDQSRAHFQRGTQFYEAGDYKSAIVEYETAYKILPIPEILFNLGQAYRLKGDAQKAIEIYQRYLAIAPNGRVAAEARGDVEQLNAQIAAARKAAAEKAAAEKAAAEKAAADRAAAQKAAAERAAAERRAAERAAAEKAAADRAAADRAAADRAAADRAAADRAAADRAAASDAMHSEVSVAAAPPKKPLYKRWWVWTAAGGAAAVLAIGLGVGLSRAPGAPAVPTSDGTLHPF